MNDNLKRMLKLGAYLLAAAVILFLGRSLPTAAQKNGVNTPPTVADVNPQPRIPQATLPGTIPGTIPSAGPDLQVAAQDAGQVATPGSTVVYTIQYINADALVDATGVELAVFVPDNTVFNAGASSAGWDCPDGSPAGATCTNPLGTVAAGTLGSVTFAVTVDASLPVDAFDTTLTASIAALPENGPDPNLNNNTSQAHTALATMCAPGCTLYATTGQLTLPDGSTVPIWGYTTDPAGSAQLPGPTLILKQNEPTTINLVNKLTEASSLFFQGQSIIPDMTGAAPGGSTSYTFTPAEAGTYIYEAGLTPNVRTQVAMGMYGAIIVRPTDGAGNIVLNQAFNDPSTVDDFDREAIFVLSEIDPALHNSPSTFDMRDYTPHYWLINGRAHPEAKSVIANPGEQVLLRYVNAGIEHHTMGLLGLDQRLLANDGSQSPFARSVVAEILAAGQTMDAMSQIPLSAPADSRYPVYDTSMLLHNAGATSLGGMLTFLSTPPDVPGTGDTMGPLAGQPSVTPTSVDGTMNVTLVGTVDDTAMGGGVITAAEYFIGTPGAPGFGNAMAAQDGAFDASLETVTAVIDAATIGALPSGNHSVYVHGMDDSGNWGPYNLVVLHVDNDGPATSGLVLDPNPSGGAVNVHLSGTGNDTGMGDSNIAAAEYFTDTVGADGTGSPMSVNVAAPIASLDVQIPASTIAGLSEGLHVVFVHSQDAFGHWGPTDQINLFVDHTGPNTSYLSVWPNPTNGAIGVNPTQPAVRLDATFHEVDVVVKALGGLGIKEANNHVFLPMVSQRPGVAQPVERDDESFTVASIPAVEPGVAYVKAAEGFIDCGQRDRFDQLITCDDGTGFPLTPADGLFDEADESAYAFIPLTTLNPLPEGEHIIWVHAQDGVGNWDRLQDGAGNWVGPHVSIFLDKTSPAVNNAQVTPNPTGGAQTVTLTADAADGLTNLVAAEWFVDVDPGPGNGAPMAAVDGAFDSAAESLTANVDVTGLAPGDHVLALRARDAAGNWSPVTSVTLTVTAVPIVLDGQLYFSTLGGGNGNPVPGVAGPYDDADVYAWDGAAFSRLIDGTADLGLPGNADIDGLTMVAPDHFFLSFNRNGGVNVPGLGNVQDEDIVEYNAGVWSLYFEGRRFGMNDANGQDIDAFDIVEGILYFSTVGGSQIRGVNGPYDDADIYAFNGVTFSRVFDASANGLPGNADIDGLDLISPTQFRVSFNRNGGTNVPGLGAVSDESVVEFNNGTWTLYFDGTTNGLNASNGQDVDAIWIP